MTQETRHLTAVHGDVAGYSKLTADNEIETHATLQSLRRIIEEEIAAVDGEVVQFVGDEFLAVVPTEAGALTATPAIQHRIAEANETLPAGRKMRFRLGVNAGEISVAEGQWYGDAINIAARLQALADPGGINVSKPTLDAAGDVPFRIESLGKKRLKNIPEPVSVFRIVDDDAMTDHDKPWRKRIPVPKRPSLAVSPFINLGDPADDHFANGLMMALVIALMRIPGLDLVSENSTLLYRDQPFSAQQLGHELGVRYVLEGAVQRSGSTVRVMTQLVDVEESTMAWADQFEASFEDTFEAQDDIVTSVVTALDIEVLGGAPARLYRDNIDHDTVEVIYRGLSHLSSGGPEDLRRAIEAGEEAIEREPDAGNGYRLAALAHVLSALWGGVEDPSAHYAKAEEYAVKALEHDDASGLPQTVLAQVRLEKRDWDGALEAAQEAAGARPSCDVTYGIAASVMRFLGRTDDAVDYANRAIRLSPLFASWYSSVLASAEFVAGNYADAQEVAEDVVAEDEDQLEAVLTLAAAQAALGQERHAAAAVDHARELRPGLSAETLRHDLPYRDEEALGRFIGNLEASGLD